MLVHGPVEIVLADGRKVTSDRAVAGVVGLVTVEHDEYGSGNPDRIHAQLFADMIPELGLCPEYGTYLDAEPAATLAEINFMSLCGLHRRLREALVGQLVIAKLTSSPSSDRLVQAMRRLGCGPAALSSSPNTSRPTGCTSSSSSMA